jgi:hypothetical protein
MMPHQPELIPTEPAPEQAARNTEREKYLALLAEKLKDPAFRAIEGFPIAADEAILALSDPPYHTKVPHKAIMRYILHYTEPGQWQEYYQGLALYLLGSLKFPNLSPAGRRLALVAAAMAVDLWQQPHHRYLPSPYKGLAAFEPDDAPLFFGRKTEAEQLLAEVQTKRLVVVSGPSGSGKSSLVWAGLLPRLDPARWQVIRLRPGPAPWRSLATALLSRLEPGLIDPVRLVDGLGLETQPLDLPGLSRDILAEQPPEARLLLIIDQFEELYSPAVALESRQRFMQSLLAGVEQMAVPLHILLTLRADFMGEAQQDRTFNDALRQADYKLGPMNEAELEQAIVGPAAVLGQSFEAGLVARIVKAVRQTQGHGARKMCC